MQIAGLEIGAGAALAPMAGVTDRTMRAICARHGAAFTVSEMVSAKAVTMGDKKSRRLYTNDQSGGVYGVQVFGYEPDVLYEAVRRMEADPYDFIDLNMGCPAPKIVSHGAGSGLLRTPALAGEMAKAAVKASTRPVTAKLRIGWDDSCMTGLEVAKRCEDAGVAMLAVHGRTRAQQYTPGVNHEAVAEIKRAVDIPVLFNGDVTDAQSALAAVEKTGCDGVMIGRGAMGNPWVFAEVKAALQGKPLPPPPTLAQRMATLEEQVRGMCEDLGEDIAMRVARGVAANYLKGLRSAASLRRQAVSMSHFTDLAALIQEVYLTNG